MSNGRVCVQTITKVSCSTQSVPAAGMRLCWEKPSDKFHAQHIFYDRVILLSVWRCFGLLLHRYQRAKISNQFLTTRMECKWKTDDISYCLNIRQSTRYITTDFCSYATFWTLHIMQFIFSNFCLFVFFCWSWSNQRDKIIWSLVKLYNEPKRLMVK